MKSCNKNLSYSPLQMAKERYELVPGKEILTNGKYKKVISLQGIISDIDASWAENLLSIKIREKRDGIIEQYNIETTKYITNMTTHNGLDLHLVQHNKETKDIQLYSPYSSPGYNIYTHALCAYYDFFKKKPLLNFPNTDKEARNECRKDMWDIPLNNEMQYTNMQAMPYLNFQNFFQQDSQWIFRIIPIGDQEKPRTAEWLGIKEDEAIIQTVAHDHYYNRRNTQRIYIEKDLINLFLQAFIDTNRCVAWPMVNLNLKKIADVLYSVLENEEMRKNNEFDIRARYTGLED